MNEDAQADTSMRLPRPPVAPPRAPVPPPSFAGAHVPLPPPFTIDDYTIAPYGQPDGEGCFRWRLRGPGKGGAIERTFAANPRPMIESAARAWLREQGLVGERPAAPAATGVLLPARDENAPTGQCWVVGCTKAAKARRLCAGHYTSSKEGGTFDRLAAPPNGGVAGGIARQAKAREERAVEVHPEAAEALLRPVPAAPSEADHLRAVIRDATGLLSDVHLDEEPEDNAAGLAPRIRALREQHRLALTTAREDGRKLADKELRAEVATVRADRDALRTSLDEAERGTDTLAALYELLSVTTDVELLTRVRTLVAPKLPDTADGLRELAAHKESEAAALCRRAEKLDRAEALLAQAAALRAEALAA